MQGKIPSTKGRGGFFAIAKKTKVVLGDDRRWFFKLHLFRVLVSDTTPALRATPSAEGEYPRATFYERNTKALDVNSPFLEGVDFFISDSL